MSNTDFRPNPKKMSTEELTELKDHMEIDPERFKEDLASIEQELTLRQNK